MTKKKLYFIDLILQEVKKWQEVEEETLIQAFEFFGYSFEYASMFLIVERFKLIGRNFILSEKEIAWHYFQFSRAQTLVTLQKVDEFEDDMTEKFEMNHDNCTKVRQ